MTVTDPYGKQATSPAFSVTVSADTTAPTVQLSITPSTSVATGTQVTFLVFASDDVSVASLSLSVGGTSVPLDSKGQAVMTMSTAGSFTVTASAGDPAGNTATTSQTLTVSNPTGTPPTITPGTGYPAVDAVITAPRRVKKLERRL